jgi:hypothetical protein
VLDELRLVDGPEGERHPGAERTAGGPDE